jgi:hypothetical protein
MGPVIGAAVAVVGPGVGLGVWSEVDFPGVPQLVPRRAGVLLAALLAAAVAALQLGRVVLHHLGPKLQVKLRVKLPQTNSR